MASASGSWLGAQEKRRGFRAGSRLVLWLWCTLLSGVVRQATACQGVRQLGLKVQPTGLRMIQLGDALDLRCVTTDGHSTADDIEFRIKERVIVSKPPTDIADFACISYNLEGLKCSWISSYKTTHNNYSLFTVINGQRTEICRAHKTNFNRFSCTWSTVSVPRYRQLRKILYVVLSSSNVLGKIEQNFTIDHFSVVKPAPVNDFKILSVGSHSVQLQWKIPLNMIDLLPVGIKHKMEYRVSNVKMALERFLSVDTSSLPLHNSTYTVLLSELPHAHM